MVVAFIMQQQAMGILRPGEHLPQPDRGTFHEALRNRPNSMAVTKLLRSLALLSRAR
jgi:hypothetical protein